MNGLCLFAGICGIELGLKSVIPDFRTVCYVENDRYAQGVITSRIRSRELDDAPIWDDVRTFDGRPWRGCVDIITGGFPCQDISIASIAGTKKGITKESRSGLWFEFERIISEIRPSFVFVENVPRIIIDGLYVVLASLAKLGYDATWCCLEAETSYSEGQRFFLLAWLAEASCKQLASCKVQIRERSKGSCERLNVRPDLHIKAYGFNYKPVPSNLGMASRPTDTLDRIRCIGNSVIPRQAAKAWEILYGRINEN